MNCSLLSYRYLECVCSSTEHTIKFTHDKEDFYVQVQMSQYAPWHKRVWWAIRYVFGYQSKHGHWDTALLGKKSLNELKMIISDYEKELKNVKK